MGGAFITRLTQIAASTNKTGTTAITSNDVTNYEVRIRLDRSSYADLINTTKQKTFVFRPGMNASADIKTKRVDNVLAVPITAVAARVKGSDESIDDKKKETKKEDNDNSDDATPAVATDELEEVVFVLKPDSKVEKRVVTTGIQDIYYIQILNGLKEGEQIITAPYNAISKTLKTGTKVTIVAKDKLFEK